MKPIEWQDARSIEWGLWQAVYDMESLLIGYFRGISRRTLKGANHV
jgi:hypothetical protein